MKKAFVIVLAVLLGLSMLGFLIPAFVVSNAPAPASQPTVTGFQINGTSTAP